MEFDNIKYLQDEKGFDLFSRNNICLSYGKGCKIYDINNKEYTDFLGGIAVNCLGYGDEDIISAISNQAKKIIHNCNLFYNEGTS